MKNIFKKMTYKGMFRGFYTCLISLLNAYVFSYAFIGYYMIQNNEIMLLQDSEFNDLVEGFFFLILILMITRKIMLNLIKSHKETGLKYEKSN